MISPVTNNDANVDESASAKSLVNNIATNLINTSTSLATANLTKNPIDIVNAAIQNAENTILDIGMTELIGKIDTTNKLKLYVKYTKDATNELSIEEKYYIATDDGNTVVKKVEP